MSGGADSLASFVLLKDKGHDLLPFHARMFPSGNSSIQLEQDLESICKKLGARLHILDLADDFQQIIIDPFIRSYLQGLTPNPCALCNAQIKFSLMLDKALALGATHMATGHYAKLTTDNNAPALYRGKDRTKDQSYFLSLVPTHVFKKIIFPLGQTSKSQVLKLLHDRGIVPPVKAESSEICFVQDDYRKLVFRKASDSAVNKPGPIVNSKGLRLGTHSGLWRYTQGQRRGLGIACEHPLYVLKKNLKTNTLVVGPREELIADSFSASRINMHKDPALWPEKVFVQTRYRQDAKEATVNIHDDFMKVNFLRPGDIPAPGQIAVVYSGHGQVLSAGIVNEPDS